MCLFSITNVCRLISPRVSPDACKDDAPNPPSSCVSFHCLLELGRANLNLKSGVGFIFIFLNNLSVA